MFRVIVKRLRSISTEGASCVLDTVREAVLHLGQFIFSGVINSTFSSINTQNFPEGHYILHLSNANSYITHRFVILHP